MRARENDNIACERERTIARLIIRARESAKYEKRITQGEVRM